MMLDLSNGTLDFAAATCIELMPGIMQTFSSPNRYKSRSTTSDSEKFTSPVKGTVHISFSFIRLLYTFK